MSNKKKLKRDKMSSTSKRSKSATINGNIGNSGDESFLTKRNGIKNSTKTNNTNNGRHVPHHLNDKQKVRIFFIFYHI